MFLDTVKAQRYLDRALARGGDFAELFEEEKWTCSVSMLNGKIEAANSGERWGCQSGFLTDYAQSMAIPTNRTMKKSWR
ncbi:MAG: hypothetical protein ACLSA6_14355 [Holdemania massiliensis]